MGTLIAWGLLAAVILGGAWAIRSNIEGTGERKAEARLQPQITSLAEDKRILTNERNACKAGVEKLAQDAKDAEERKKQAGRKAVPKLKIVQSSIAAQQQHLAAPMTGATCEEAVSKLGRNLLPIGAGQLRDQPPEGTGANQGPSTDTMRITN